MTPIETRIEQLKELIKEAEISAQSYTDEDYSGRAERNKLRKKISFFRECIAYLERVTSIDVIKKEIDTCMKHLATRQDETARLEALLEANNISRNDYLTALASLEYKSINKQIKFLRTCLPEREQTS